MVAPVAPLLAWAGLAASFVIALAAVLRMAVQIILAVVAIGMNHERCSGT